MWLQNQYKTLIATYQLTLPWNNTDRLARIKSMHLFLSLYLKTPLEYRSDGRNYSMFNTRFEKLPRKLQHKFKRVIKQNFK